MLNDLLPSYEHLTVQLFLLYVAAGAFGALVRIAWLDKPLRPMYRDRHGYLRLGFVGEIVLGIAVALIVDHHPIRAGLAAIFAPYLLDMGRDFLRSRGPAVLGALFSVSSSKEE